MSRAHPPPSPVPPRQAGAARARVEETGALPNSPHERATSRDTERGPLELRLAIGKDGLGIELAEPARFACIDVVELVVRLPYVKFPFDVSGGVAKFRHKRGELERVSLELDARHVARWAEPRLRGLVSAGPCRVIVAPRAFGATFTVVPRTSVAGAAATPRVTALVFELVAVASSQEVSFFVHGARGANVLEPPTTLAIRAASALLGDSARREGSRFVVTNIGARLARALLPEAGVRAPAAEGIQLAGSGESDGVVFASLSRSGAPAKTPEEGTLAAEAAFLAREGDEARLARDLDRARQLDLAALERAPKHPELARRIAEIDRHIGGRAEAARVTLGDLATPIHLGLLAGELALEAGDANGAVAALLGAAERESSPLLGALAYARAAEITTDLHDALAWLDAAVARAPQVAELRWERARRRLEAGRLADARADFQELEALAQGARDRHDVLRRAGDVYRRAGLGADAALLYERALVYRPDDPESLAGLGAALAAEGRAPRGASILAHAITAAEAKSLDTSWMVLELGKVLGELVGDRPAAVARLRTIPDDAPEAIAARGLEGRFRARLGDLGGASLAFARLRERAGREPSALAWLEEAASFELERGDLFASQRHLAAAISIQPNDPVLESRYRAIGETIARRAGVATIEKAAAPDVVTVAAVAPLPSDAEPAPPLDEAAAEARVEALTQTLQGDPTNDSVVDELTVLLTRLGRSMDLLALLSARLEDAPPDRREALLPKHRDVLATLEREARAEGRDAEADLFKMAREAS